jgi:DNA-binding transcriptional MerR regulator
MYSIGEVAEMFGLSVSTIRYYDREGLLRHVSRDPSGIRRFNEADLELIRMIEYLKKTGMQLKDIRTFVSWCEEGDASLEKRLQMFHEQEAAVEQQMRELKQTMELIRFKCWYYEQAAADGTEKKVRAIKPEEMPASIRRAFENSHEKGLCWCHDGEDRRK